MRIFLFTHLWQKATKRTSNCIQKPSSRLKSTVFGIDFKLERVLQSTSIYTSLIFGNINSIQTLHQPPSFLLRIKQWQQVTIFSTLQRYRDLRIFCAWWFSDGHQFFSFSDIRVEKSSRSSCQARSRSVLRIFRTNVVLIYRDMRSHIETDNKSILSLHALADP